jgi:hypothetical protein
MPVSIVDLCMWGRYRVELLGTMPESKGEKSPSPSQFLCPGEAAFEDLNARR